MTNRAIVYRDRGEHDRAITELNETIRTNPNHVPAWNARGWAYNLKKDYDRAIADFDQALRLDPRNTTAFNDRARTYVSKGDNDRGIADYSEVIRIDPKAAYAFHNRGLAYRNKNEYDRAITDFDEAIRLDPKYVNAYANRGWSYNLKKDYDRAIADYDQALRLDPKASWAFNDRGRVWRNKGDLDRAIADYSETIRLDPKAAYAYNNRGNAYRTKGDHTRAIADFDTALQIDPSYIGALTNRGLAYEALGDRARARADFTAALALPQKYDTGKWAHDTARVRLAVLPERPAPAVTPPPRPPVATVTPSAPLADVKKVALVIGNGKYAHVAALPNPVNDARAVAKIAARDRLRRAGRDRSRSYRPGAPGARLPAQGGDRAGRAPVLCGTRHAGRRQELSRAGRRQARAPSDLTFETLELDKILNGLDDEARTNIIILDACRDNPLAKNLARKTRSTVGGGLAAISNVGSGTLIAYATLPGSVALDGAGANSPFTAALLKHMRTPGLEVRQMLTRVRADVRENDADESRFPGTIPRCSAKSISPAMPGDAEG